MTLYVFGFLRVLPGRDLRRTRRSLRTYLRHQGCGLLGEFVVERPGDTLGTWREMIASCHEYGVDVLIVPSLKHLHDNGTLAEFMRDDLARRIDGRVWVAGEPRPSISTEVTPT